MRINMLESLTDNIAIDKTKCTFCGICVETCILDNLRLQLAPCRQACPLGVNCHGYVQLIARGQEKPALELLRASLPFPGILGRICSQPCEGACHRQKTDGQAVAVRALKRYLMDQAAENAPPLPAMAAATGKRVAVIGSGPAGMLAAYDLRVQGHAVTIFEADPEPGGMLRWAIPEFRLPAEVLRKELALLTRMGIDIQCGTPVGRQKPLAALKTEFHALILATGCPRHLTLNIDGENLPGVHHGLPFLRAVREGRRPPVGQRVVVIGGGNVAVDAAQTALRLGAASVTLVTLEATQDVPAFPWALASALSENIRLECSWGNPRLAFQAGVLTAIELQRCVQVFDACNCFQPVFDDCQVKRLEADTVIVAIGQTVDTEGLATMGFTGNGIPVVDPLTLQSAAAQVFLAGDVTGGPSSVVEAMAQGRRAAVSVDRFLKGEHLRFGREYPGPVETEFAIDTAQGKPTRRVELPGHRCQGKDDFQPLEQGLDPAAARREAQRCYSCGQPFGKYRTCWFCLPCEVECPHDALWVEIPYLLR